MDMDSLRREGAFSVVTKRVCSRRSRLPASSLTHSLSETTFQQPHHKYASDFDILCSGFLEHLEYLDTLLQIKTIEIEGFIDVAQPVQLF